MALVRVPKEHRPPRKSGLRSDFPMLCPGEYAAKLYRIPRRGECFWNITSQTVEVCFVHFGVPRVILERVA